jgi:hypothetical protein
MWQERKLPPDDKHFHLDSFHDYLTLPVRQGLQISSMHFLREVLRTQGAKGAEALIAVRAELFRVDQVDFDEMADQEKAKLLSEGKLAEHGTNQHTRGGNNVTSSRGNNAGYLAARLARDHPELSKRTLLPKSHKDRLSIHAAAVEAGIAKRPTPYQDLCRDWKRASPEERERFLAEISRPGVGSISNTPPTAPDGGPWSTRSRV